MNSHPIYLMALVTTLLAFVVGGTLIWQFASRANRLAILVLVVLGLPLSPVAFYFVRTPIFLDRLNPYLAQHLRSQPAANAIKLLYAPITEEPAKLLPLFLLMALGTAPIATRRQIPSIALALGLGFAVGEIWFVAYMVAAANMPEHANLPWYAFGGFLNERLICVLTHSLFVLPTLWLGRRGWIYGCIGLLIGMSLHYLGNAPIVLMQRNAFNLGHPAYSILLQMWIVAFAVTALMLMILLRFGGRMLKRIWKAQVICPECGAKYKQPIFLAMNMGTWRYERCEACKRWHWISLDNLVK